ncbi:MAG TPA: ATP-binding cassette domain-containing protein [Acidobacteriaceae bacterium]|jgi:phospholipid/cholesterol/gamma-HCH transport system ATP-binding protein|nr:ATP-binding cassette domain-containing protein [Acidobacteriaceae bacterium]
MADPEKDDPQKSEKIEDRLEPASAPEEPLTAELSADVAPVVEEFMEEAAKANVYEAQSVADQAEFWAGAGLAGAEFATVDAEGAYISFENVSKSFGDFVVLQDVSFSVNPGETLCILGRSGVGKSVSLQILMGFLKADSGTVRVAGQNIAGFNEGEMQELRRKVTMVFQSGALFDSISVGENVAFPLRERGHLEEDQIRQVVKGLLEMVGVAGMEDLLPSGLSTGMKRSVAIARALAAQPAAILYDEPTTMVDPLMAHLLGELIQRLKMQLHLTSIVVTHDTRFAQKLADRVVLLHEGRARFLGTMEEMQRSSDPVLKEFLSLDELVLPA